MNFQYAAQEKFSALKENYAKVQALRERFWNALCREYFVRLSDETTSPYILSLSAKGLRGEIVLHMSEDKGLLIGTGSACSSNSKNRYSKVILAMGYDEKTADGLIRISFSSDTTEAETDEAAQILNAVVKELRERMNIKD